MGRWIIRICQSRWFLLVLGFLGTINAVMLFAHPTAAADVQNHERCVVLIRGPIEQGDEEKFRRSAVSALETGCLIVRVSIYSPGGSYTAAIEIAKDIRDLYAYTEGPTLTYERIRKTVPRDGLRSCKFIPFDKVQKDALAERHHQEVLKAYRTRKPSPPAPIYTYQFDPKTGRGNSDCVCASACFFVWMAGAERWGDSVLVHRPYFEPNMYSGLSMIEARTAFRSLTSHARQFLNELEVPNNLIDRIFSTPSDKAVYLTKSDIESLRTAPYYHELKTSRCGPEPVEGPALPGDDKLVYGGPYKHLTPSVRRRFIKLAEREICWRDSQTEIRQKINSAFVAKYKRP